MNKYEKEYAFSQTYNAQMAHVRSYVVRAIECMEKDRRKLRSVVRELMELFEVILEDPKNQDKQVEINHNILVLKDFIQKGNTLSTKEQDLLDYYAVFVRERDIEQAPERFDRARERLHILEGIIFATEHADQILGLILDVKDVVEIRRRLVEKYQMSDRQAEVVAYMRLRTFTENERQKLINEKAEVQKEMEGLMTFLEKIQLNSDK